jgi:two-component system chemotaxis response regulator CheB
MVVDDSAVIRGLLTRVLESEPSIAVVASVSNGEHALRTLGRQEVDVVVLDIEMPVMDGLTALPKIIAMKPEVKVIMASTLTRKNADVSLKALSLGAADYIPKPTSTTELHSADEFKRELTQKVMALAGAKAAPGATGTASGTARSRPAPAGARPAVKAGGLYGGAKVALRPAGPHRPEVIAIASSTGGPQALMTVLGQLGSDVTLPILITQHMPPTFTTLLAEHIAKASGRPCREGREGEPVLGGTIYIAPGARHMEVASEGGKPVIHLTDAPPENFCRPAADPMLRSMVKVYGGRLLLVVLTGMGADGCKGADAITRAGGTVIAQDEASSVVWGMPGAVATAGLCTEILPLTEIAPTIGKYVMRSAA